jgi:hypothetical protein
MAVFGNPNADSSFGLALGPSSLVTTANGKVNINELLALLKKANDSQRPKRRLYSAAHVSKGCLPQLAGAIAYNEYPEPQATRVLTASAESGTGSTVVVPVGLLTAASLASVDFLAISCSFSSLFFFPHKAARAINERRSGAVSPTPRPALKQYYYSYGMTWPWPWLEKFQ